MWKKLLRWLAVVICLLLLLAVGFVVAVNHHLESNREKLLQDFMTTADLDVAFRRMDIDAWNDFPRVTVIVDSLVVRDSTRASTEPALADVQRLRAEFSVARLLRDTLDLRRLLLRDATFFLRTDERGNLNTGRLGQREAGDPSPAGLRLHWQDGLDLSLRNVAFSYHDSLRNKRIVATARTTDADVRGTDGGLTQLSADIDLDFGELGLNTEKGSYLTDAPVRGSLTAELDDRRWEFSPTQLTIGSQEFEVSATINRGDQDTSYLRLANPRTDYELTQALLPDTLRAKLAKYAVDGQFPVSARVALLPGRGSNPEVTLNFSLEDRAVRLRQHAFTKVTGRGRLVNRLTAAEGGIPGSRKNLRITLDTFTAYYGGVRLETTGAKVAVVRKDPHFIGPLQLTGPANAMAKWLGNRDYLFGRGRFHLATQIDASLLSFEEIITTSDGELRMDDVEVIYAPAGVRFPFARIEATKRDQNADFRLRSRALPTGFSFTLAGAIDNLTPLLIDQPGAELRSEVSLVAPRIDWTDFLAFFGEEGYLAGEENTDTTGTEADERRMASVKAALVGIQRRFHPNIDARFDTVAYYDVFQLTDFTTGLHFSRDTLILERTTFNWAGSDLGFGARLDLARSRQTPFAINVLADHLNLNRLRPALNYFGLQLPAELDSLPSDLSIRFDHAGRIGDASGILPGYNAGNLVFDDGRAQLFEGHLRYAPTAEGLSTQLTLSGDPQIVNVLFGSENFFFGTGRFSLDLSLVGTPANLRELVETGVLQLRIDSSQVAYRPSEVVVPVRQLTVDVDRGHARYAMHLSTDSTNRSIRFRGELDRLAAFLAPEPGERYRMRADATAETLSLSDLQDFMQSESTDSSSSYSLRSLLSATGGVFASFRPDLSLRIDTFWATANTPITNLQSGLHMRDSTRLVLERTGFDLGGGRVAFGATYTLDEQKVSPFQLNWQMENLTLEDLREQLPIAFLPPDAGTLRGKVSSDGTLTGLLNETTQEVVFDSTAGRIGYRLTDLELIRWPGLLAIGKKAFMRKRFEHLRFAPMVGELEMAGGRLTLPRTEVQSTGIQVFTEGEYRLGSGPDLLISLPLRNVGRGVLTVPPAPTGYDLAGWKVYLVAEAGKDGKTQMKFRLGRRRFYRERGRLDEFLRLKAEGKATRRAARRAKRGQSTPPPPGEDGGSVPER